MIGLTVNNLCLISLMEKGDIEITIAGNNDLEQENLNELFNFLRVAKHIKIINSNRTKFESVLLEVKQ